MHTETPSRSSPPMGLTPRIVIDYNVSLSSNQKWIPFEREKCCTALRCSFRDLSHSSGETQTLEVTRSTDGTFTQKSLFTSASSQTQLHKCLFKLRNGAPLYTLSGFLLTVIFSGYSGTFSYNFHTSWYTSICQEGTKVYMYNFAPFPCSHQLLLHPVCTTLHNHLYSLYAPFYPLQQGYITLS